MGIYLTGLNFKLVYFITINGINSTVGGLLGMESVVGISYLINSQDMQSGQELDLGAGVYGLYLVSCTTIGRTGVFAVDATPTSFIFGYGNSYGDYSTGSSADIVFGRKELNGNIFIKNNSGRILNIRIKRIKS